MTGPGVIVVRRARAADEAARAELVRQGFASHHWEAFLLFFFQELTLQCCVLGGAVLFIFCGVSAAACALLLPAAALAAAAAVYVAHLALADSQVQKMRQEIVGLVAEYRGPLVLNPSRLRPPVVVDAGGEGAARGGGGGTRLVGTVSVSECWGTGGGWMHALAVHPQWRRRGVGRALVGAAVSAGAGTGGLDCVVSELQHAVRSLLHSERWEARGWYHRQICGRALTLQLARFTAPPPPAPQV